MLKAKPLGRGVLRSACLLSITIVAACIDDSGDGSTEETSGAPEDKAAAAQAPLTVEVPGGAMVAGFATGRLRKRVEVPGFRIMKHPATRGDYESCVAVGACDELRGSSCARAAFEAFGPYELDADDAPLICVAHQQARQYCKWIGGRLPTLGEWQFAARGETPQRFPWGGERPACEQHPRATKEPEGDQQGGGSAPALRLPCLLRRGERSLVVGVHSAGASPYGVEDLLLTPGELLSTDGDAHVSACTDGFEACIVYGLEPGAIDSAMPVRASADGSPSSKALRVYGFRCVMEG